MTVPERRGPLAGHRARPTTAVREWDRRGTRLRRFALLVSVLGAFLAAACTVDGGRPDHGPTNPKDFPVPPIASSGSPLKAVTASDGPLPDRYGFGAPASSTLIDSADIDIAADGHGLPAGSGTVATGERQFAFHCSRCHGPGGLNGPERPLVTEKKDRIPGFPFANIRYYFPTVGNYWPYAPTLFSYIRKAMPQDNPGSLDDGQVYAIVAYLLWRNGIIGRDSVVNARTLAGVVMPARGRFVVDRRRGGPEIR